MEICTLASSSSGNSTFISAGGTKILIDAGISMRRINASLRSMGTELSDISAILITHEHTDHIHALKMIHKYYRIPVFVPQGVKYAVLRYCPELCDCVTEFMIGDTLKFGGLTVTSFQTPHDASASVGYRISDGEHYIISATDMGYVTRNLYNIACGASFVLIESNHDVDKLTHGVYPYPLKQRILSDRGHLSNSDCGRLCAYLAKSGTKRFLLAHLSKENNTPQLAYEATKTALENEGFIVGEDVFLDVAPADEMTARYII